MSDNDGLVELASKVRSAEQHAAETGAAHEAAIEALDLAKRHVIAYCTGNAPLSPPDLTTQEPQEAEPKPVTALVVDDDGVTQMYTIVFGDRGGVDYSLNNRDVYVEECAKYGIEPAPAPQSEIIDATEEVTGEAVEASVEGELKSDAPQFSEEVMKAAVDESDGEPHVFNTLEAAFDPETNSGGGTIGALSDPDFGPRES